MTVAGNRGKSKPKGQHYYPLFNLNYFTDTDGLIWVYDSYKNEIKKLHPKVTAKINHFYSFDTKEGKRLYAVEELLAILEGEVAPVIEKIHSGQLSLGTKEKSALAYYIALQYSRTPMQREQINKMIEQVSKKMLQVTASNKDYYERTLEKTAKKHPDESEFSVEEMQKFIFDDKYRIEAPKEISMQIMVQNLPEFASIFFNLGWSYYLAPKNGLFLTSDVPLAMRQTNPNLKILGKSAAGLAIRGTEVTLPLTSKVCLFLSPRGRSFDNQIVSRDAVRLINARTTQNCLQYVFSSSGVLLKRLVKLTRLWKYRPIKELVESN